MSLSILECHLGLIFEKEILKFFERKVGSVHSSHVVKFSFLSLGFERERARRGATFEDPII
jgi:hypothetical protein